MGEGDQWDQGNIILYGRVGFIALCYSYRNIPTVSEVHLKSQQQHAPGQWDMSHKTTVALEGAELSGKVVTL